MSLYDFLLHLYPKLFRNAGTECEMRAVFARRRRSTGRTGTIGLWLRTIAEVLFNAAAVYWDRLQQDNALRGTG